MSLDDYVKRMPEGQDKIYYALGPSRQLLEQSPHLESLKQRGYEVLFMTDGVDQWSVEGLAEFEGKPLANAMEAEQKPEAKDGRPGRRGRRSRERARTAARALPADPARAHVSEVRVSERLTDSPVCLVMPKGGVPAHIERMLRAYQQDLPAQKRILELNPNHALIAQLKSEFARRTRVGEAARVGRAALRSGAAHRGQPAARSGALRQRLTELMEAASSATAQVSGAGARWHCELADAAC